MAGIGDNRSVLRDSTVRGILMKSLVNVTNLNKTFGDLVAVDNISFEILEGETLGLLGPNGAGKTTTIQMLLGLITPDNGAVNILGKDFSKNRVVCLKRMNFSSAYIDLPRRLTVWENLDIFAKLYEVEKPEKRILELLRLFRVDNLKDKRVYTLSSGQLTSVYLCKAFINRPRFVLLDEPTVSLDPDSADKTRKFIRSVTKKEKTSVLFTSHNMAEVSQVCDRVIFLDKGKIIATDTPIGLARRIKVCKVRLLIDGEKRVVEEFLRQWGSEFRWEENVLVVKILEERLGRFLNDLAEKRITFSEISIEKPTLEDFFLGVARGEN